MWGKIRLHSDIDMLQKGTRNTDHACKTKSTIYMYIHVSKVILNLQATLTSVKLTSPL